MNANTTKTIIGTLLPFASNPVVLTVLGVGAAAWAIASLFDDDTETEGNGSNTAQSRSEPSKQPFKRNSSTVQSTVREPLTETKIAVAADDIEPLSPVISIEAKDETTLMTSLPTVTAEALPQEPKQSSEIHLEDEEEQKELIRKAMSELGKRSAAARSQRKKAAQQPT